MKTWIALLLLALAPAAWGDIDMLTGPVTANPGFLTGEKFLKLGERDQASYTLGLMDGYLFAPSFGADQKYLRWIIECIKEKTQTQIAAIFRKYLEQNPEEWDKPANMLMFNALSGKACVPKK